MLLRLVDEQEAEILPQLPDILADEFFFLNGERAT
jgi:hypothetical protein